MHLAAEIASQRDADKIHEVNVEGTRRLVEAAQAARVKRFVFASTVVTGEANGRVLREDEPLPVETAYGRSKQEGERLVRESEMHGVIVRPGHVYGPGGWYAEEFVRRLQQPGRFAVIGRGDNLWDVVHVDDVAVALADAVGRAPDGAVYHVADDEPLTYYDFVKLTADALGVGPPRRIPAGIARAGRGPRPGHGGGALGAHVERAREAGAEVGAAVPERARGHSGRGREASGAPRLSGRGERPWPRPRRRSSPHKSYVPHRYRGQAGDPAGRRGFGGVTQRLLDLRVVGARARLIGIQAASHGGFDDVVADSGEVCAFRERQHREGVDRLDCLAQLPGGQIFRGLSPEWHAVPDRYAALPLPAVHAPPLPLVAIPAPPPGSVVATPAAIPG